jgi:hypothetical protein
MKMKKHNYRPWLITEHQHRAGLQFFFISGIYTHNLQKTHYVPKRQAGGGDTNSGENGSYF